MWHSVVAIGNDYEKLWYQCEFHLLHGDVGNLHEDVLYPRALYPNLQLQVFGDIIFSSVFLFLKNIHGQCLPSCLS